MVTIHYTLTVYVTQAVEAGDDPKDYISKPAIRELERSIIRRLSTRDGDTDCEVIETTIVESNDISHV